MLEQRPEQFLHISLQEQRLRLVDGNQVVFEAAVSTAKNGPGETNGSGCTPRGWHRIIAKVGDQLPINSVFVARRPTGEIYSPQLAAQHPGRDWILSRILWLKGCEPGKNLLHNVDTMRRFIYIHGTPETNPMGTPESHGCIRMHNNDLLPLFARVPAYLPVYLSEQSYTVDCAVGQ